MRITYLHQYFNTPAMPGSTRSYEMARRLVAAGHDVQMVTSDKSGQTPEGQWRTTEEAGIEVHWLGCRYDNTMSIARRLRAFAAFGFHATKRSRSLAADVVFSTSTPLTIGVPGVLAAQRRDVPHVFEVRDWWPAVPAAMGALQGPGQLRAAIALEKWIYRRSEQIVALAPGMRDGVISRGFDADRTSVIPNSCDFDLFDVGPEPGLAFRERHGFGDRPIIAYTGTLGRVNNIEYLVDVAAAMKSRDPDTCFVIVGGGSQEPIVRERAAAAGVLDRSVFLLPPVHKGDLPAVNSAATFCSSFVSDIPILADNCANKFFDSLAATRPMIVNHGGWLGGLIEDERIGLRLPNADAEAAAEQIAAVAHDRAWTDAAGRRAYALGRREFCRDLLAQKLEAVLCKAAGVSQTIPMPSLATPAASMRKAA